jgi:hypothetical protein
MRRLVVLGVLLGGLAWWLWGRRSPEGGSSATIGFADGSSVTLEAGSPELDRLLLIAAEA